MRDAASTASADGIGPVTSDKPLGEVLEFLRALWGVNHALETTSRQMKMRLGVTGPERMVVRLVGRYPGISAGDLARILRVHPSTLTGLLKRLTSKNILRRRADAGDARRALFELTAKGQAANRVKRGTVEASVKVALASLPDREVRAAAVVLESLKQVLESSSGVQGPTARVLM